SPESVDGRMNSDGCVAANSLTLCMHDVDRVKTQISISQKYDNGQGIDRLTRKQGESRSRTRILVESACYKNVITPVQAKGPAILSLPKWFVQGADNEF